MVSLQNQQPGRIAALVPEIRRLVFAACVDAGGGGRADFYRWYHAGTVFGLYYTYRHRQGNTLRNSPGSDVYNPISGTCVKPNRQDHIQVTALVH